MDIFFQYLGIFFFVIVLLYLTVGGLRYWKMCKTKDAKKTWKDAFRVIFLWPMTFWVI